MCYRGGRGVVPTAGIRPGQMIVKFRGLDMSRGRPRKSMTWQENIGLTQYRCCQVAQYGGRGHPTASGSGRCLPETSLAGARTQETVGGPNGAQRSEFRRTAPPAGRHDDEDIQPWKTV